MSQSKSRFAPELPVGIPDDMDEKKQQAETWFGKSFRGLFMRYDGNRHAEKILSAGSCGHCSVPETGQTYSKIT